MSSYTISIIGGGNVAFRLSIALHTAGHKIVSIYNRDSQKAEKIIRALKKHKSNTILANSIDDIPPSDIILICVSDGAIKEIASKLTNKKSLILHTSGATDISVLKDCNIVNEKLIDLMSQIEDIADNENERLYIKIRYRSKELTVRKIERKENILYIKFSEKASAITPGQSGVIYYKDMVVAGGIITDKREIRKLKNTAAE